MRVIPDNSIPASINHYMGVAILQAMKSTCKRSKCGSVVVSDMGSIIGVGFNSMPCNRNLECFKDAIPVDFKSDRSCCVHSEQRAISNALSFHSGQVIGSTLYFIRLDLNNNVLRAGKPFCTFCSKRALDEGIVDFVLWHEEGITIYNTKEYNELSFQYKPELV